MYSGKQMNTQYIVWYRHIIICFFCFCICFIPVQCTSDDSHREYIPGDVIAVFAPQDDLSEEEMELIYSNAHVKIGAEVVETLACFGYPNFQLVRIPAELSVEQAVQDYFSIEGVLHAEPNHIFASKNISMEASDAPIESIDTPIKAKNVPNDPYYSRLWGLDTIMVQGAWETTTGLKEVVVAVIDSGVDYTHPDLAANIWKNSGEISLNGIDEDGNGFIDDFYGWDFGLDDADPMDYSGHGTHIAGIIGAVGNNGIGVTGVNWNVSIMPVKITNDEPTPSPFPLFKMIKAIFYASQNGAHIINISMATPGSKGKNWESYLLQEVIRDSPALIVFAAGNYGLDLDAHPLKETIDNPNVIIVAAADKNGNPHTSTNYGKESVHVAAPGVNIYSTFLDNEYKVGSGTSMAAPFVSGLAALIKAANPNLTASEIKTIIMDTCDASPEWSERVAAGGIVNAENAIAKR